MPKLARKKGESGFYHAVPKGISDMMLFEDDKDRSLYLKWLKEAKEKTGVLVHAYCLMSNHVHLVLEDPHDDMAEALKYVHERYCKYFAEKTGRCGGIYRRPYWSEPIENDNYFLCAVRYVHANPAAAGICSASAYEWSSVKDYLGRRSGLTDTELALETLGGRDGFIEFSKASNMTAWAFPGSKLKAHLTDDEAIRIAKQILGEQVNSFASMPPLQKDGVVCNLRNRGFSSGQIARILGISKSYVIKLAR